MAKKLGEMTDTEYHALKSASVHGPLKIPVEYPLAKKEKQISFFESEFYKQLKILKAYFVDLRKRIYERIKK